MKKKEVMKDLRKSLKSSQLLHKKTAEIYEELGKNISNLGELYDFFRGLHKKLYKVLRKAQRFDGIVEDFTEANEEEDEEEEKEETGISISPVKHKLKVVKSLNAVVYKPGKEHPNYNEELMAIYKTKYIEFNGRPKGRPPAAWKGSEEEREANDILNGN